RPYLAPPGVPTDRLAALRQGFMDTMTDKEFLAEAEANKFEINPVDGEELEKLVKEAYRTPPEIAKKAADAGREEECHNEEGAPVAKKVREIRAGEEHSESDTTMGRLHKRLRHHKGK